MQVPERYFARGRGEEIRHSSSPVPAGLGGIRKIPLGGRTNGGGKRGHPPGSRANALPSRKNRPVTIVTHRSLDTQGVPHLPLNLSLYHPRTNCKATKISAGREQAKLFPDFFFKLTFFFLLPPSSKKHEEEGAKLGPQNASVTSHPFLSLSLSAVGRKRPPGGRGPSPRLMEREEANFLNYDGPPLTFAPFSLLLFGGEGKVIHPSHSTSSQRARFSHLSLPPPPLLAPTRGVDYY